MWTPASLVRAAPQHGFLNASFDRASLGRFLWADRRRCSRRTSDCWGRVRRRTPGLRRVDVAELCSMSVDYVARFERRRWPSAFATDGSRNGPRVAAHPRSAQPPVPALRAPASPARAARGAHQPRAPAGSRPPQGHPAQVMGQSARCCCRPHRLSPCSATRRGTPSTNGVGSGGGSPERDRYLPRTTSTPAGSMWRGCARQRPVTARVRRRPGSSAICSHTTVSSPSSGTAMRSVSDGATSTASCTHGSVGSTFTGTRSSTPAAPVAAGVHR